MAIFRSAVFLRNRNLFFNKKFVWSSLLSDGWKSTDDHNDDLYIYTSRTTMNLTEWWKTIRLNFNNNNILKKINLNMKNANKSGSCHLKFCPIIHWIPVIGLLSESIKQLSNNRHTLSRKRAFLMKFDTDSRLPSCVRTTVERVVFLRTRFSLSLLNKKVCRTKATGMRIARPESKWKKTVNGAKNQFKNVVL